MEALTIDTAIKALTKDAILAHATDEASAGAYFAGVLAGIDRVAVDGWRVMVDGQLVAKVDLKGVCAPFGGQVPGTEAVFAQLRSLAKTFHTVVYG